MSIVSVPGKNNKHKIMLYALSTCVWCRKMKELLDAQEVAYDYVYVDQCQGEERTAMTSRVRELNPRGSYPTLQIDDEVVVGFDEDRVLELLQK